MVKLLSLGCWCASAAVVAASLSAQAPDLRVQPTVKPFQSVSTLLLANPFQTYATYLDAGGAGSTLFGERFWLSATPTLSLFDAGVLDAIGARAISVIAPGTPALVGAPIYFQSFVLDASAPNGTFRASNGQSLIVHNKASAITFAFRDPIGEGITGDYDASIKDRILAAPIRRRTATIEPASGLPFAQPVATPLLTKSARLQHVYRAADFGAQGVPEYVTALRWKPLGPVAADNYPRVQLTLGHSTVVPDYSIDPFSALPKYPLSGLAATFAANFKPLDPPVIVSDGPYAIRPSDLRPDGYLGWPAIQTPFLYNGFDSIVIDYRVVAGPATLGRNGFSVRLMVTSDPHPDTRAFAPGNGGGVIDPFTVTVAGQGDNSYYETQIEFTATTSRAVTPFVKNPGPQLRPYDAYVAGDVPLGTSVILEYEGANSGNGAGATGFFRDPANLIQRPWLRVRVLLECNPITGARPSVDTLVIPVD